MIRPARIFLVPFVLGLCGAVAAAAQPAKPATKKPATKKPATKKTVTKKTVTKRPANKPPGGIKRELFAGRVVMLGDALKRRGVKSTDEFPKQVVLETPVGELIPIVPDWRGRAFYQDKRLRNRPVELVGYRRRGIPYLQVLMVFTIDRADKRQKKTVRQYFDYWCDICSIPMYEIKACECCQADIDLRLRPGKLPAYLTRPARKHSPKTNTADAPKASGGKSSE